MLKIETFTLRFKEPRFAMRVALTGLACLLMFGAFYFLELRVGFFGGEQVEAQWPTWAMPAIFAVSTFSGVFARSIYEVLTRPNPPKTYHQVFLEASAPNKLLLSLIAAPVVMCLLYKTVRLTDDTVLVVVSAFQNGFFWKSIVRQK